MTNSSIFEEVISPLKNSPPASSPERTGTFSCPPFPEEVWIKILRFVRDRDPEPEEIEQRTDAPWGQRDLAGMMRVSSVFHDLVGPILYRSVVAQDLDTLLYGLFPCRRVAYFARLEELLVKREAVRKHCAEFGRCMAGYGCHGSRTRKLPAPGESEDPLAYLQLDNLLPIKSGLDKEIRAVHREVLQTPQRTSISPDSPALRTRMSKRTLVGHTRRLHLSTPQEFPERVAQTDGEGSIISTDPETEVDGQYAIDPLWETQLGFFFGLHEAIEFLKQQQTPVFVDIEHFSMGKKYEASLEYSPGFYDADGGERVAILAVRDEACALLSWLVQQMQPRTICRYHPHRLAQLGTAESPLRLSANGTAVLPILTLHNVTHGSILTFFSSYRTGTHAVGGRIRYIVDTKPAIPKESSNDDPFDDMSRFMSKLASHLAELMKSLQACPEWAVTNFEIVIPRITDGYFEEVKAVLKDSIRTRNPPPSSLDEWHQKLLASFRSELQNHAQWNRVEGVESHLRVITDLRDSPWENCSCAAER